MTGVTQLNMEIGPKLLELMHEVVPTAKDIALLVNPKNPNADSMSKNLQKAAGLLGVNLHVLNGGSERDIDAAFANELSKRFGAPGDAAMAYVIAHEVGHHVQDLLGSLGQAEQLQARASKTEGNAIQVHVELQADCYAGVWAANARDEKGSIIEPGDVEEAMRAAEAVGDDTLQKQAQGYVVPDSFTHGTSAQRIAALKRGLQSGDPAACKSL